ncbi:NAD kinase [Gryllotalpicola sp.]|uniref:NAD kinase n=1 Tax=Gryllotalpicola sp. TaxID=1932787 RepID=UPI0026221062|nr:NAD kinase [Gryllotalpicola sp.]
MSERFILVVVHAPRPDALEAAKKVLREMHAAGVTPVLEAEDRTRLIAADPSFAGVKTLGTDVAAAALDLVIVLGGDGTILRAAELVRGTDAPLLGVNLGHVGFLAELERDDLAVAVARAVDGDYTVEERMTIEVRVKRDGEVVWDGWALNDASVEKASRERMLEVALEVNKRPLSTFGCDGIVISTPTGSTAYSFSAGGPVVWPTLHVLLVTPLSAHALFARPLVLTPETHVAVEILERTTSGGILWCDGRRSVALLPGDRVVATASDQPVRLARLHQREFTDRLVRKFDLPVAGWRGTP